MRRREESDSGAGPDAARSADEKGSLRDHDPRLQTEWDSHSVCRLRSPTKCFTSSSIRIWINCNPAWRINSPTSLCSQPTILAIGSNICTEEFPYKANSSSRFTALCDSI